MPPNRSRLFDLAQRRLLPRNPAHMTVLGLVGAFSLLATPSEALPNN
ncbi:MAG: hypothetical protein P8J86_01835 [Phycisphaerales bacterium]|nr:hypothetical protein [Phycisphaerales bacterium]